MSVVVGYVPHELVLATTERGDYILRFNIRTYDNDNNTCLIPCIADMEMAKNLFDEFEKKDSLVVWGQLKHKYVPSLKITLLQLKVISYTIVVDVADFIFEASMSVEKKQFLKKASDLFDEQAPLPTEEEIAHWREHWRDYKKKNFDPKIPKERVKTKNGDKLGKIID
jgi:hypothetical protein